MLDLGIFHRQAREVSIKEALGWTLIWVSLALLFNGGLYLYSSAHFGPEVGRQVSLEFFTGFIMEKALAVDNLFVFILVFNYFQVPLALQHRVLFLGIMGALIFRSLFIALGAVLIQYHWVSWGLGLFLIYSGWKIFRSDSEPKSDLSKNTLLNGLLKIFPVTNQYQGAAFLVKDQGRTVVTPLLVALVFLELSDIMFAVDSVPAIFGITQEPFIVFTSNILAILGLRSMFFMISGLMHQLTYLPQGLALVLMFVGLKMTYLNQVWAGHFPIGWSLAIIGGILLGAVLASVMDRDK